MKGKEGKKKAKEVKIIHTGNERKENKRKTRRKKHN
jgi:hypothetical protein